jgi:uncharacterized protein YjcR
MKTHSIADVAEALGVSPDTVKLWISRGELVALNVSLNRHSRKPRLRVRESDLETFLNDRQTVSPMKRRVRQNNPPAVPRYV